jgi:hypothetical protein
VVLVGVPWERCTLNSTVPCSAETPSPAVQVPLSKASGAAWSFIMSSHVSDVPGSMTHWVTGSGSGYNSKW